MELSWLEDFLALVESGNFSRAAERRNMTQPAFSRRIRALEDWVGAPLFDRETHRIELTVSGEQFRPVAEDIVRRLSTGREAAREAGSSAAASLKFASTHALSLTFFPAFLRKLEADTAPGPVRLIADSMVACERIMLQGQVQFLLCHHHPAAWNRLDPHEFHSLHLGHDTLLPVTARSDSGEARFVLPGEEGAAVPYLAYSEESGIGRIVAAVRGLDGPRAWLDPVFTSHVATVLKSMATGGRGIAWLPLSLLNEELDPDGSLVRAGDESWDIGMEIRLFRPRSRQSDAAEAFWAHLTKYGQFV